MTSNPPAIVNDSFAARMGLFYAAFFLVVGLYQPFFPLWLEAKGLDASAIGIVLAAPMFVRILAIPAGTRLADRLGALRGTMIVGAGLSALGLLALGFVEGFAAILVLVVLLNVAAAPVLPLGEAYALKGLALRARSYGPVRLWGSIAFIAANLGGGLLLSVIAPRDLIWAIAATQGALALAALALLPTEAEPPRAGAVPAAHDHLRDPRFIAIAAGTSLIQASHAVYYGFSALSWSAKGFDGSSIGVLWALGVVTEIVLFAVSGRLFGRIGPVALIMIGAGGAVLRWTAMALDPPALLLPFLQALHGLSFGATFIGTQQFLSCEAPEGRRASAQGDVATAYSVVMAGMTALAGVLFAAYADRAYLAMALAAGLGAAVILAGRWFTPRAS